MKIALIVVRTLFGLMFLYASVVFLFKLTPQPELKGNAKIFMDGMIASGYLMTLVKITELVCSLAFISNRFAALASVVIFPITVNIFFYHAFNAPEGIIMSVVLLLANLFIAYGYKERYSGLWSVK